MATVMEACNVLFCTGQAVQGHAHEHLQPELLHDDGVRSAQLLRYTIFVLGPSCPFLMPSKSTGLLLRPFFEHF
jgi:hypothetical protein